MTDRSGTGCASPDRRRRGSRRRGTGWLDASTTTSDGVGARATGWVSTTMTSMPASVPSAARDVGADPAEDRDDEVDAAVGAQVLEHGGEAVVGRRGRRWRAVDDVVARVAAGAEDRARARRSTSTRRCRRTRRATDRGRGLHRDLERLRVVALGVHVEHDRGLRAPARLVLADHELAGAGGRAPVHAAQVVAQLVLAQGEELVAEVAHERARRDRLGVAADAAADRDRRHDRRARAGARAPRPPRPRSSVRRARPNGSDGAHRRAGRPGSGRAVAWGCGTRHAPSRPGASGGTRKRAARRPSSNQSVAVSSGVAPRPWFSTVRSMRPSAPTWRRSGRTRRVTAEVGCAAETRARRAPPSSSETAASASASSSTAPSR